MTRLIKIPAMLILVAGLAALPSAAAVHTSPFNGHMSGSSVATSEVGNNLTATIFLNHLGRSQLVGTTTVTGQNACGGFIGTEKDTITAPNGDKIFLFGHGVSCPTSPTTFQDTVTFTITGGTGRFADASGSGTTQTAITITSQTTATFTATITGTISR